MLLPSLVHKVEMEGKMRGLQLDKPRQLNRGLGGMI